MIAYQSDYFTYQASKGLMRGDPSFYSLLMAAMRKADTFNEARLRSLFPTVWDDLVARYDAPGGVLPSDPQSLRDHVLGAGA